MYVFMQIIITYDAPTWKHFQLGNRLRIFWAKLVQNDQTHQMTPCEKIFNLNIGWLGFYLSEAHRKTYPHLGKVGQIYDNTMV